MWTDEAMRAEFCGMFVCRSYYCILHHDTVIAQLKRLTFGDNARAKHNAAARANHHITADRGIWRYVS
jgi:hypothetical protein